MFTDRGKYQVASGHYWTIEGHRWFVTSGWQERTGKLFSLAGEFSRALQGR